MKSCMLKKRNLDPKDFLGKIHYYNTGQVDQSVIFVLNSGRGLGTHISMYWYSTGSCTGTTVPVHVPSYM